MAPPRDAPWLGRAGLPLTALLAAFLLPFALFALCTVPQADDLCLGAWWRDHGFIGGLAEANRSLSGRYFANSVIMAPFILADATGLDVLTVYPALVSLVLAAHVATSYVAVRLLFAAASRRLRWFLTTALSFVLIAGAPAPEWVIYWISQGGNYTVVALASFLLIIRLFRLVEQHRLIRPAEIAIVAAGALVLAMSNEFAGPILLAIVAGAQLARLLTPGLPRQWIAHLAIAGAIIVGTFIVATSGATWGRVSQFAEGGIAGHVGPSLRRAAVSLFDYVRLRLTTSAVPAWIVVVALATWFYDRRPGATPVVRRPTLLIILPLAVALAATYGALAIGYFGIGMFLPTRSRGLLHFVLMAGLTLTMIDATRAWGERMHAAVMRRWPKLTASQLAVAACVLMILTPKSVLAVRGLVVELPTYRAEMGARLLALGAPMRRGGTLREQTIVVPPLTAQPPFPFAMELAPYTEMCAAMYHGYRRVQLGPVR